MSEFHSLIFPTFLFMVKTDGWQCNATDINSVYWEMNVVRSQILHRPYANMLTKNRSDTPRFHVSDSFSGRDFLSVIKSGVSTAKQEKAREIWCAGVDGQGKSYVQSRVIAGGSSKLESWSRHCQFINFHFIFNTNKDSIRAWKIGFCQLLWCILFLCVLDLFLFYIK